MVYKCAIKTCKSTSKNTTVSFFRFPKDQERLKQWIEFARRPDLLKLSALHCHLNYKICGKHFEKTMFLNDLMNRLQPSACPTIFDILSTSGNNNTQNTTIHCDRDIDHSYTKMNSVTDTINEEFPIPVDSKTEACTLMDQQHSQSSKAEIQVELLEEPEIQVETLEEPEIIEEQSILKSVLTSKQPILDYKKLSNQSNSTVKESDINITNLINSYCRLCSYKFKTNQLIPLFNQFNNQNDYQDLLELCVPGLISKKDKLPQKMCRLCLLKLKDCKAMIKGFIQANNELRKLFQDQISGQKDNIDVKIPETETIKDKNLSEPIIEDDIEHIISETTPQDNVNNDVLELQSHSEENEEIINYGCMICDEICVTLDQFMTHSIDMHQSKVGDIISYNKILIDIHNRSEMTNCSRCSDTFDSVQAYRTHQQTHQLYKCIQCEAYFNSQVSLIRHRRNHSHFKTKPRIKLRTNSKETLSNDTKGKRGRYVSQLNENGKKYKQPHYLCSNCGQRCRGLSALKQHELVAHREERPYTCDICSRSFKLPKALRNHKLSHTDERNYMCQNCGKTFAVQSYMKMHMKRHCDKPPEKRHFCTICGAGFVYPRNLKSHIHSIHEVKQLLRYPRCRICNVEVPRSMLTHMNKEHAGCRPFQCDLCDKDFNRMSLLNEHMRSHTGERPYKCNVCNKQFRSFTLLNVHRKKSHAKGAKRTDTENVCNICNKRFTNRGFYTKHMWQHENKPYVCNTCGKAYRYKYNLNVHCAKYCSSIPSN